MTIVELEDEIYRLYGVRFRIEGSIYLSTQITIDFGNYIIHIPVDFLPQEVLQCLNSVDNMKDYRIENRLREVLDD